MIEYRAFRNTDPPYLVDIWQQRAAMDELLRPVTTAVFESQILAKPFFDRLGLIVALQDGRPIGFVHAGFGPTPDGSQLDYITGLICMLRVAPGEACGRVSRELIARAEAYLHSRGARTLQAGAASPRAPYYQGLYGGSLVPGVLATDSPVIDALHLAGYTEIERRVVTRCIVSETHPVVDRATMLARRGCNVQVMIDPPADSWWDACTGAWQQRFRFTARSRRDGSELVSLTLCQMQVPTGQGGTHVSGISHLRVLADDQREDLLLFVLGEAIRQLRSEGMEAIEAHVRAVQDERVSLLRRLGFQDIADGVLLSKQEA